MPRRNVLIMLVVLFIAALTISDVGRTDTEKRFYEKNREFHQILSLILNQYYEDVEPDQLFQGAYQGMLNQLDPYCYYFTRDEFQTFEENTAGEFGGLGIEIGMRDGILTVITPIPDTPAWEAGVLPGDRVLYIEGESTEGITLQEAVKKLRGERGTEVTITVRHQGAEVNEDITITRSVIEPLSLEARIASEQPRIAYLRAYSFSDKLISQFDDAVKEFGPSSLDGFILDLRGNAGGLFTAAVELADRFLDEGVIVRVNQRSGEQQEIADKASTLIRDIPVVVLVNRGTASASEIVSGALQDHGRAMIVGTPTFGKGAVQKLIPLQDHGALKLTTAMYHTPDDRPINQEHPVQPDVQIEMDPETILGLRQQELEAKLRGKELEQPEEEQEAPEADESQPDRRVVDIQLEGALAILKSQVLAAQNATAMVGAAR